MDDCPSSVPAPPSPSSSDEDTFNTANSRVYFGPLQSPEKKFTSIVSPDSVRSFPASSSAIHDAVVAEKLAADQHADDALENSSQDETRERQEVVQELLGETVIHMSLKDSPSPSSILSTSAPLRQLLIPSVAIVDTLQPAVADETTLPMTEGGIQQSTPSPQVDLISFESVSRPAPVFRETSPMASTSRLPSSEVDDLLTGSPKSFSTFGAPLSWVLPASATLRSDDPKGKGKVREPIYEVGARHESGDILVFLAEQTPEDSSEHNLKAPETGPLTPPRRLRRSYRFSSPFRALLATASEQHSDGSSNDVTGDRGDVDYTSDGLDHTAEEKSRETCRLFSLSPTSTQLLGNLVSAPAHPSSAIGEEKSPERPECNVPPFPQPSLHPAPTSPIRFFSPTRATGVQSPTKVRLQPANLADPTRTPARRVPVEEAIRVFPSLKSHSPRTPGPLISRSPLKIPVNESPTRRVPMYGAMEGNTVPRNKAILARVPSHGVGSLFPSKMPPSTKERSMAHSDRFRDSPSGRSLVQSSPRLKFVELPFPITTNHTETDEHTEIAKHTSNLGMLPSSPVRSISKQTMSKIPRPKPYARPNSKPTEKTRFLTAIRAVEAIGSPKKQISVAETSSGDNDKPGQKTFHRSVDLFSLKRKREEGEISSLVKPLRKVPLPSGITSRGNTPSDSSDALPPSKKPLQIRLVPNPPPGSQIFQTSQVHESNIPVALSGPLEVDGREGEDGHKFDPVTPKDVEPSEILMTEPNDVEELEPPRRATRRRKSKPAIVADVFGTSEKSKASQRAKSRTSAQTEPVFLGMSAVALKALTTSNTERNQRYVAAKLETEVIRKEGNRPESPMVKVRTVLQRKQDEKREERRKRAERRANGGKLAEDDDVLESDPQSDEDDSSVVFGSDSDTPLRKRHVRGPGDDEDYQTPKIPSRSPISYDENEKPLRRVKWDRGLFTYLDEAQMGERQFPAAAPKGCLAPHAKTLMLDNHGNLPNAGSPPLDLVEECVVVKKYVYDNDAEPTPVVEIKSTRTKSKRARNG